MTEERTRGDAEAAAWRRAAAARARAARAAEAADRQDLLSQRNGSDLHKKLAAVHRDTAAHHLTAAEMHEDFARRLSAWSPRNRTSRPLFMTSVAAACGADSGALVLLDPSLRQLAVASSDERSAKAQDLEYVLGEGPMCEAAQIGRAVAAEGPELAARWPTYGPGVLGLGLHAVAAAPLTSGRKRLGALAVFHHLRLPPSKDLQRIATVLSGVILLRPEEGLLLYGGVDEQSLVHQATGMVSVEEGCSVADALDLIKARSFREGTTTDDVAHQIVHSGLRLTSESE